MGKSSRKRQVLIYLPPQLHQRLRLEAASTGKSISELVERALTGPLPLEKQRVPLAAGLELPTPEVVDALAEHGAPLWSSGRETGLPLERAIAAGLLAARRHASLLHVLPIVLLKNLDRLSWPELRAHVHPAELPALGMLLDLAAAVTGTERFRDWATELWAGGVRQDPPAAFFVERAASARYLALAEQRTPQVVRRWGFLMATPVEDFAEAVRRHGTQPDGDVG